MDVIVLSGGISSERDISIRSGECVARALKEAGYSVAIHDTKDGLEELLPVFRTAGVIFPALHGLGGEDGQLQKFLEDHNISFVGSGSEASKLCFDKHEYGKLLSANTIDTPSGDLVTYDEYLHSYLFIKPHVVKPLDGGSSIDTFIIRNPEAKDLKSIELAFKRHESMLLQELIEGHEITVPVIDGLDLPVIEIITPDGAEFDYENKYNGLTDEACPPKNISEPMQQKVKDLAHHIHELTGCRDISRTDMIITESEDIFILETNTIPGLTDQSTIPKAADAAGYSMAEICKLLVEKAISRI